MLSDQHQRYLRLLGFTRAPADFAGLRAIVSAHLQRVPFENVSKLLLYDREGAGRPIALAEFLDGIEHHDLGGTCYSSNPFLYDLLRALGYDVSLLSADMRTPDVHSSIRVWFGGKQYHVDVGYAAPFAYPIPLNRLPHTVALGTTQYVIDNDRGSDRYQVSQLIDGQRRHGYVVHPPDRDPAFFTAVILDSFQRGRTFMQCLRISRMFEDRVVDLQNRTLTVLRRESTTTRSLDTLAELRRAVDTDFRMPRCPVEQAVAILEKLTGKNFFGEESWADSLS